MRNLINFLKLYGQPILRGALVTEVLALYRGIYREKREGKRINLIIWLFVIRTVA